MVVGGSRKRRHIQPGGFPESHTLHPTLHPTPFPEPHTLHPTPCTLHPTPCIIHHTPYTIHPTPYTLHPALYSLLPTAYPLLPTPYSIHGADELVRSRKRRDIQPGGGGHVQRAADHAGKVLPSTRVKPVSCLARTLQQILAARRACLCERERGCVCERESERERNRERERE